MDEVAFRAAFALAELRPLVWLALPPLRSVDTLWAGQGSIFVSFAGHLLAILSAMIAFVAQLGPQLSPSFRCLMNI